MNGRVVVGILAGVAGVFLTSAIVPAQIPPPAPPPPVAPAPAPFVIRKEAVPAKAVIVQKAAVRVAMPAPPAMAVEVQFDEEALVEQFVQQFRPILRAELHRARTVCQLSEEQRREIGREGEWIIKDAAQRTAEIQQRMMRGRRVVSTNPDVHKHILEGFARIIDTHLTQEQSARYRAEVASRAEERKTAAIRNLIALLDQDLLLSADQRTSLTESLAAHWNEPWAQTLEQSQFVQNVVPNIPDPVVTTILDSTQRDVWRNIPKNTNVYFNQLNLMFDNMGLDEGLAEDGVEVEVREDDP